MNKLVCKSGAVVIELLAPYLKEYVDNVAPIVMRNITEKTIEILNRNRNNISQFYIDNNTMVKVNTNIGTCCGPFGSFKGSKVYSNNTCSKWAKF